MAVTPNAKSVYSKPSGLMYYNAYFQELVAEALAQRWKAWSIYTGYLTTLTASSSAIAGWTLWADPGWRVAWVAVAGFASFASITHTGLKMPERVRVQERLRQKYVGLRVDIERFRERLALGVPMPQAQKTYDELAKRYDDLMKETETDIACTKRFQRRIQKSLNRILGVGER